MKIHQSPRQRLCDKSCQQPSTTTMLPEDFTFKQSRSISLESIAPGTFLDETHAIQERAQKLLDKVKKEIPTIKASPIRGREENFNPWEYITGVKQMITNEMIRKYEVQNQKVLEKNDFANQASKTRLKIDYLLSKQTEINRFF